jgi:hypothetical protein
MAVIDELGVGVSVLVNGSPLPEFDDPSTPAETPGEGYSATRVSNKYIECVNGAEFAIQCRYQKAEGSSWIWRHPYSEPSLSFQVFMDGAKMKFRLCREAKIHHGSWASEIRGFTEFDTASRSALLRKFKFASILPGEPLRRMSFAFH